MYARRPTSGGGGGAVKRVDVADAAARRALTPSEVNVGDIVRELGLHETTDLNFTGVPGDGEYVTLYDRNGSVVLWCNFNGGGSAPGVGAREVMIGSGSGASDGNDCAAQAASFLSSDPQFNATAGGSVVTLADKFSGVRDDASAGGAFNLGVSTAQQGTADIKFAVIDTDHLDSDAFGYAQFVNP